jgi:hypothetical protein
MMLARLLAGVVRKAIGEGGRANSMLVSKTVEYSVITLAVIAARNQIQVATVVSIRCSSA